MDRLPPAGRPYRYLSLVFWHQGGHICVEDTKLPADHPRHFQVVFASEWDARRRAIVAAIGQDRFEVWDERMAARKFAEDMQQTINDARRYGDPMDPGVMGYHLRHRGKKFKLDHGGGASAVVGNHATGYDDPRNAAHPVPVAPADRAPVLDLTGPVPMRV